MPRPPDVPNRDVFAEWVREALARLYDSPYLERHPLADLLTDEGSAQTGLRRSQQLRQVLLEAIRAMRPGPGVPARSPDWRAYRILEARYIEGLSPREVMEELALGKSQYFRDQARVLKALTDVLWKQWQQSKAASEGEQTEETREDLARAEAERLCTEATWETVNVADVLMEIEGVVRPLAQANGVSIRFALSDQLTIPQIDRVMLRQAILNLITCLLDAAQGGDIEVDTLAQEEERGVRIVARGGRGLTQPEQLHQRGLSLDVCAYLVEFMGGRLELEDGGEGCWEARMTWPTDRPRVLLVVDDNEAFVALFRRYLVGHNWQVVGARSGAEAREVIGETRPAVIILDVMMPKEDGWDLLMSLKADKRTRDIPVIVCSVLNEPDLALSLGAVGYLAKPVTQEALLRALSRWNRPNAIQGPTR